MTSWFPFSRAKPSAVFLPWLRAFGFAPCSIKMRTHSAEPARAANISGVIPPSPAALNTLKGSVIGACKDRHRRQEFFAFLKTIERKTPLDLHLVLGKDVTHKHPKVKVWLETRPRFHLHFVPTSCSWLNLVERFFAKITTRRIRTGSFSSVRELEDDIKEYLRLHNQGPKPFRWTASTEAIMEKIVRCRETYDSLR